MLARITPLQKRMVLFLVSSVSFFSLSACHFMYPSASSSTVPDTTVLAKADPDVVLGPQSSPNPVFPVPSRGSLSQRAQLFIAPGYSCMLLSAAEQGQFELNNASDNENTCVNADYRRNYGAGSISANFQLKDKIIPPDYEKVITLPTVIYQGLKIEGFDLPESQSCYRYISFSDSGNDSVKDYDESFWWDRNVFVVHTVYGHLFGLGARRDAALLAKSSAVGCQYALDATKYFVDTHLG